MEHTIAVNKKIIKVRIGIYAAVLAAWILIVILAGISSSFYILFITGFLTFFIIKNIKKIWKYNDYGKSEDSAFKIRPVPEEIFFTFLAPVFIGFVIMIAVVLSLQLPELNSSIPLQYKFSKTYIEKICGSNTDFLPEKLPEGIKYYNLKYFPGCMQASPILTVDITTDDNSIAEIKKEVEKLSVASFDLEQYIIDNENEEVKAFKNSYFKPDDQGYTNDTIIPRTGAAGKDDGHGTIYVISSNGDWNHPHSECITINFDTNTVTYSF